MRTESCTNRSAPGAKGALATLGGDMTTVAVAVVVGVVIGLATGGRLSAIGGSRLRSRWLLVIGTGLIVGGDHLDVSRATAFALVVVSYGALAAFGGCNVARPGMSVVLIGILLNALPIAVDRGMPVEGHAIVASGAARAEDLSALTYGAKRHLAGPGDHLRALDDTIPDWLTHEVVSFGDIVIAVGVTVLVTGLLKPLGGRRRGAAAVVARVHSDAPRIEAPSIGAAVSVTPLIDVSPGGT